MNETATGRSVASDITTLITLFAFAVIYFNLLIAVDALGALRLIPNNLKPVGWLALAAAFSPFLLVGSAVWEFTLSFGHYTFAGANPRNWIANILRLGSFLGAYVFLFVMSWFVAYQSSAYLAEFAPGLSRAFRSLIGIPA